MSLNSGSLDWWRRFFQCANSSMFEIIEQAIGVAAADHPMEFRLRRSQIAEKLFSRHSSGCTCGEQNDVFEMIIKEKNRSSHDNFIDMLQYEHFRGYYDDNNNNRLSSIKAGDSELISGTKQMKINIDQQSKRDEGLKKKTKYQVRKYSYGEAEALREKIGEENERFAEVLRIKELLENIHESEYSLLDALRRLEPMALTVEIMKVTQIGRAVSSLRRHKSKRICEIAKKLIHAWRKKVDEWIDSTASIAEISAGSDPYAVGVDDEEGLPPPLDKGAPFATQTPVEVSKAFASSADGRNPRNSTELGKNHEKRREQVLDYRKSLDKQKPHRNPNEVSKPPKDRKHQSNIKEFSDKFNKFLETKRSGNESASMRNFNRKLNGNESSQGSKFDKKVNTTEVLQRRPIKFRINKKPIPCQKHLKDAAAVETQPEPTKRKLQLGYQTAESVKKRRTTQFIDLPDLPSEKGHGCRKH